MQKKTGFAPVFLWPYSGRGRVVPALRNLAFCRGKQVVAVSHEGQVARAVAHADAEDGTVLGAVVLLQVGDGVRLVEPGGEDGEVVAVLQQAAVLAEVRAQAGGGTRQRRQVAAGAFDEEVEGDVVVADEAGVEGGVCNAGGECGEGVAAGGGQATAACEPVAVGCAIGAEDDAAVVDDGVVGEGEGDAAVGVVVARGGGDDAGVRLPVREQGLLYGRGV